MKYFFLLKKTILFLLVFLIFTEGVFVGFLQFCLSSTLPLLIVSGAVVWAHACNKINSAQNPSRTDGAQRYVAALALVALLGVFGPWQVSQIVMDRGDMHLAKNEMDAYYADINKAGKLSGERNPRALKAAASVPLGIVYLNAPLMDKVELQKIYEQGKDLLDRAALQNVRNAEIYYLQAELLGKVALFLELAPEISQEEYLEKALVLDPELFPARIMLARIKTKAGDKEQAYQIMLDGMDMTYQNSNPAAYYQQLTIMVQEMGDSKTLGRVGDIVLRREMARRLAEKP